MNRSPSRSARASKLLVIAGLGSIAALVVALGMGSLPSIAASPPEEQEEKNVTGTLLPTDRIIKGTVVEVTEDHAKVNTGELTHRFLALNKAEEKGFTLRKGDRVEIAVNPQNLVVDYHPAGQPGWHRILRGHLAQPLVVGQEWAVIRTDEGEQAFAVRPLARSKLAGLVLRTDAIFLLDEVDKIIDVTQGTSDLMERTARKWAASPPRSAYQRVEGTLVEPTTWVTIRTKDGQERKFEVMPQVQHKLLSVPRDTAVTLLIDGRDRVMDVAAPSPGANPNPLQG